MGKHFNVLYCIFVAIKIQYRTLKTISATDSPSPRVRGGGVGGGRAGVRGGGGGGGGGRGGRGRQRRYNVVSVNYISALYFHKTCNRIVKNYILTVNMLSQIRR